MRAVLIALLLVGLAGAEILPAPRFPERLPAPKWAEPVYRIGSLPPTWVPPAPVVYPQVIYPTPTYTPQAVPWCPPGG